MNDNILNQLIKLRDRTIVSLHLRSIRGKIFTIFTLSLISIAVLTVFNFWNLSTLKTRMMLSERYDDLLNDILEVRRFEKNYLIYGDHQSLVEGRQYLDKISALVDELAEDLPLLIGREAYDRYRKTLFEYGNLLDRVSSGRKVAPEALRDLGKTLTVATDQFRQIKRSRIHATIKRTSIFPFAFLCIFLPLMALVIWLVSYGLVRPLNIITKTTGQVGRGDFRPINYQGVQLEEVSGLIEAFNRMALELEANQEDLVQARKIAAIGTFTAGVAHELNNPINNIVLTAESFAEIYSERIDEEGGEMLRDILGQAERAAEIVKNLLDFSRTENPTFGEIGADDILKSSINLLKNQIKMENIELRISVAERLPAVRGNRLNLQQVFTNLLLNAIQETASGGTIRISAERAATHGFVDFSISDSGPGIPFELQHKIFEPFFSTKEVGKGTGLGLSVCYSIVKRHGGTIKVDSREGEGATFTVSLPAVDDHTSNDFIGWTAS